MSREDNRTRLAALALTVVTVLGMATACSSGSEPDQPEPSPPPWTGEFRYEAIEAAELCEGIDWNNVGSEFGMTVDDVRVRDGGYPSGQGMTCELRDLGASFLIGDLPSLNLGGVSAGVYEDPRDAHTLYQTVTEPAPDRYEDPLVEEVDGWWSSGISLQVSEQNEPYESGTDASVFYLILHENLYVNVQLTLKRMETADDVAYLHGFARALIDEVRAQLPCRSIGDTPATGC